MENNLTQNSDFMFFGIDGDIKNIIRLIKFRRMEKGYSQRYLASITGIKQSAIARFESNKVSPRLDTLIVILRALELKINIQKVSTGWNKFDN